MYPFREIFGAPPDDGTFTFFVTAVDEKLNESAPSEGVSLTLTWHPPIARVRLFDESGERVNRVRVGRYAVELETDQPLGGESEGEIPLRLVQEGALWRGELVVEEDTPEEAAYFRFEGADAQGNVGREILEGEYFVVDRTAPLGARELLAETDTADVLGAILFSWRVPDGDTPHFYRIWRAEQGGATEEPLLIETMRVKKARTSAFSASDMRSSAATSGSVTFRSRRSCPVGLPVTASVPV